ncbi:hypothetical protein ACEPAF_9716 [Sanghuangporus sanghuang]
MYIAGIHISNDRLTEGIVTSSLLFSVATTLYTNQKTMKDAAEKGGPVKSLPTTRIGKLITPIHAAAIFIPPVTYLIAVPLNGGVQPGFISRFALPKFHLNDTAINVLRVVGVVGLAVGWKLLTSARDALGQSFHFIGVREKPKIVSTGPYAVVRHPLYSSALAQQLAFSVMFWNYIPLASFAVIAAAFVVKIPIEESLIETDPAVGPEYVEYKKKVAYRLIPKVW